MSALSRACVGPGKCACFYYRNMLRPLHFVLVIAGLSVPAAAIAADKTNALAVSITPAEKKADAAVIPDATYKPVFTTNAVTIAGQRVTYMAEAGMLPVLSSTGTVRASVFYVAYTRIPEGGGQKAEARSQKAEGGNAASDGRA